MCISIYSCCKPIIQNSSINSMLVSIPYLLHIYKHIYYISGNGKQTDEQWAHHFCDETRAAGLLAGHNVRVGLVLVPVCIVHGRPCTSSPDVNRICVRVQYSYNTVLCIVCLLCSTALHDNLLNKIKECVYCRSSRTRPAGRRAGGS